jgi:PAS domain S-box-containing protein
VQLRAQFAALVGLAAAVGIVSLATLAWSVRETRELRDRQQHAVAIARETTGLLVLTHDYLLHREPRAQQQWEARFRLLSDALAAAQVAAPEPGERASMAGDDVHALPGLFIELKALPEPIDDTPLQSRRRELLVDRLLTSVQDVAEQAYEREREATRRRNDSEFLLMTLSVALPAAIAVLFALAGGLLARRVLGPLALLRSAMAAVAAGDLSARDAGTASDELGEARRQFASMTAQLQERTQALRASEAQLRLVTDNVPAMIGYWDRELRNRFANADYRRWFGKSPDEIHGRTILELLGPDLFALNRPYIEAALAGRRQDFDRSIPGPDGVLRHSRASYLPDAHGGRVEGFFVLVTDVTDRVRGEQALAKALAERETLLQEVHHRVKNNLQVVQSLLQLQRRTVSDAGSRDALQETALRVRAMALVHEQLYRSPSLRAVSLPNYVRDLARLVALGSARSPDEVALDLDVAALEVGVDRAVPLGLLLTELIGNAFKHAFPDGRRGRVAVTIRQDARGVRISVTDNGRGLPPDFDLARADTLGLQLAAGLARQLGGELTFQCAAGTTAAVRVSRLQEEDRWTDRTPLPAS